MINANSIIALASRVRGSDMAELYGLKRRIAEALDAFARMAEGREPLPLPPAPKEIGE